MSEISKNFVASRIRRQYPDSDLRVDLAPYLFHRLSTVVMSP